MQSIHIQIDSIYNSTLTMHCNKQLTEKVIDIYRAAGPLHSLVLTVANKTGK